MSNFFKEVYCVVSNIPRGSVMNYGMVADLAGNKRMARQVGFALHANPDPDTIPCHRVVMKDGSLTPSYAFGGIDVQRQKLEDEGVGFLGDKVDMKNYLLIIQ